MEQINEMLSWKNDADVIIQKAVLEFLACGLKSADILSTSGVADTTYRCVNNAGKQMRIFLYGCEDGFGMMEV